jgi:inhibitor of KinA sporulation pathway (predicted exonuclease)
MSQKIMVLDCEFNQPSRKTIQIGAAIYDVRNAACYGTLDLYVNPGEPITPEITDLTGITDRDVANAPNIIEAWAELKDFHKRHKVFKNPLVWGSGVRNDSSALYDEYSHAKFVQKYTSIENYLAENPEEENFMGYRVLDAKTLFQSLMLFENRGYAGGLKDCMERLGLKFEGEKHRALVDAKNTFTLWYHITRMMHDGLKKK